MIIKQISPQEWSELSQAAHQLCFGDDHDPARDRIDYTLLAITPDNVLTGFITVRELNSKHIYWQHGGAFPPISKTIQCFKTYQAGKEWCAERYESVSTYISNKNIVMLKLAMKIGFRIIGIRQVSDVILLELYLNLKE